MEKLWNFFVKPSPSKWGEGTGLLWRGMSFKIYFNLLRKSIFNTSNTKKVELRNRIYNFESCRVAIFHFINFLQLSKEDEVLVLGFTCDAVTNAVKATGVKLVMYDCSEDFQASKVVINKNTKLVINQVTFGKPAFDGKFLQKLKSKGIKIMLDQSIGYGSDRVNEPNNCYDAVVWSLEASKSITIGWGGILQIYNPQNEKLFLDYYKELKRVSWPSDIYRIISTILNIIMCQNGSNIKKIFWLIARTIGLIRKSNVSDHLRARLRPRLGIISERILIALLPEIPYLLSLSVNNHNLLEDYANKCGLKVLSRSTENYTSPRICLYLKKKTVAEIESICIKNKVELGRWFDAIPSNDFSQVNLLGVKNLNRHIINFPVHWTLTKKDLLAIQNVFRDLGNLK